MTNNNDDAPQHFYVKRHDLRPKEFSSNPCLDEYREWEWWIAPSEVAPRPNNWAEVIAEELSDEDFYYRILDNIVSNELPDEKIHQNYDPALIIQYFCMCHEWGVYPPPWIMNDLNKRFSQYLTEKANGSDKHLGEYFGESGEGTRKPFFKEHKLSNMLEPIMIDIDRFRAWFGLSIKDATAIAAQHPKLVEKGDAGFSTVEKKYKERQKRSPFKESMANFEKNPPSRELKVRLVKRYPKEAFDVHRAIFQEYLKD